MPVNSLLGSLVIASSSYLDKSNFGKCCVIWNIVDISDMTHFGPFSRRAMLTLLFIYHARLGGLSHDDDTCATFSFLYLFMFEFYCKVQNETNYLCINSLKLDRFKTTHKLQNVNLIPSYCNLTIYTSKVLIIKSTHKHTEKKYCE